MVTQYSASFWEHHDPYTDSAGIFDGITPEERQEYAYQKYQAAQSDPKIILNSSDNLNSLKWASTNHLPYGGLTGDQKAIAKQAGIDPTGLTDGATGASASTTVGGLSRGASAGAAAGSIIPGIGNVAGAVVGGALGALDGAFGGGPTGTIYNTGDSAQTIAGGYTNPNFGANGVNDPALPGTSTPNWNAMGPGIPSAPAPSGNGLGGGAPGSIGGSAPNADPNAGWSALGPGGPAYSSAPVAPAGSSAMTGGGAAHQLSSKGFSTLAPQPAPGTAAPTAGAPPMTANDYLMQALQQTQTSDAYKQALAKGQLNLNGLAQANLGQNLNNRGALVNGYVANNNGLIDQSNNAITTANGANDATLNDLSSAYGQLNGWDAANNSQMQNTFNGFSQLASTPYIGDVVSNPGDVARQQASYDQLSGISGGSLDYSAVQAALAQAASNPNDVAAQQTALQQLQAIAGGSLNVQNGANDPAAFAAQHDALGQLSALTTPQRTAQEEFLYEQQRQQEEQDQRTSRAAVMQNLRQRGMSGSGMELTNQLGSDQITSQNRLLGDLGTQANAVARSQQALANYGNLASNMNAQGNQIGLANAQTQLTAAGGQGGLASTIRGQGDAMNTFNAGQANAVNTFNAGQVNAASANNQGTRLAGATGAANQANQMRSASDAIAMNNQQQHQLSNQFQDNYAATQQQQAAERAQQVFSNNNVTGQNVQGRTDALTQQRFNTTQQNLGNTQQGIGFASTLGTQNFNAGIGQTDATKGYWDGALNAGQQGVNNAIATQNPTTANGILMQLAGGQNADKALSQI